MSKRRAERQITDRDRSEDDEPLEVFTGPGAIQVAAPEVLAERRIVKGRRGGGGKKPVESEPAPAEKPVSTEPSPFNFQMKPTDDKPVFNFTMLKPDEKPSFNFATDTNLFSFTPKSTAESPSKVLFSFSEDKELKPFTFKTPEKTQEKVEEKPLETQPAPKTPEKPAENAPEKTPEKPDEKPAEKPTEKESEKTPEKPASQATPSWSSTFSMPSLGSTEPAKFSFNTPVWPTFDTPFKGDASNPFGSITPFPSLGSLNSTTPASPFANIAATPSKLGVWGKDIAQPSAPEEQLNASIPSSPSQKIEKQVETKTGEEDEDVDFKAKAKLFEFEKDAGAGTWKERGIGEIKVNTNKTTKRSRIVMRMDSTLRLMLNVAIIPGMVVEQPNPKNVRFIAMNSINDGAPSAASFVVRLADGDGLARAINSAKAAREREEKKAD